MCKVTERDNLADVEHTMHEEETRQPATTSTTFDSHSLPQDIITIILRSEGKNQQNIRTSTRQRVTRLMPNHVPNNFHSRSLAHICLPHR